ncbi:MAG: hypothetical protein BGO98_49030 [Myxococcales bacterium 68-20]|nr:hypothetical protein [Myxococcales bacterium]OJY29771.1 MAG: hypothetical protein BGO98_49030 [Myxococcales bacterium 68-20]
MGIKPAMGWLALLLFTTTAQAGGARDLLRIDPKAPAAAIAPSASKDTAIVARTPIASKSRSPKRERELAPPVTPKTKAPPVVSVTARPSGALAVVESTGKPRADYEAEIYAGIALDAPLAKERGLDRGLVRMVFEQERRPAFRVGRDRIRRVVRLAGPGHAAIAVVRSDTIASARPRDHIDVLDTERGVVLVDTLVESAGMFTTSDVYVFAERATLDQRIAALEAVPSPARDRLREALVLAEWAPVQ